ncbi:MAG TPA: TolC family protein [Bryobacteraceae bacterium]|nr:TolC family protein [Bryobacteraceae bacterium]
MAHRRGRVTRRLWIALWAAGSILAQPQKILTWEAAKAELRASNPNLIAGQIGVQQSRADEVTAHLRPNPDLTLFVDQLTPFTGNPYRPFGYALPSISADYLIERRHKRDLRLESAKEGTQIAISELADQERNLVFDLRAAFVQVLQQKAVLALTRENLGFYDRVLEVSRDRFKAGDIAQMDLDRLELQRAQYESDLETAAVALRTAKIQLRALLNDRTPVDRLDVEGKFEYAELTATVDELRQIAMDNRPDLRAAVQSVTQAKTNYRLAVANGSADPVISGDFARESPDIPSFFGIGFTIPLRIFDRNQGEKARAKLDIARNERLEDAARLQIASDVESAYAAVESALILLRPYKSKYLEQAVRVRESVTLSYQHGAASLLDFLQAQQDYRGTQLSYLNLVGAYLSAAAQLNLAVGREVIP